MAFDAMAFKDDQVSRRHLDASFAVFTRKLATVFDADGNPRSTSAKIPDQDPGT